MVEDQKPATPSDHFREMAARIECIKPEEFSGAMLIVMPEGKSVAVMMVDPTRDLEAFLAVCAGKLAIETTELQTGRANHPQHGRR